MNKKWNAKYSAILRDIDYQLTQQKTPEREARLSELRKQFSAAIAQMFDTKPAKNTGKRPQEARTDSARPKTGKLPQGKLKPLKNDS